jgi:histidine triad (HIT) family protein
MDECIFCKIVDGELPSYKIWEDESVFAFLDINPVNEGHVLIIPKFHYQNMVDVPDDVLAKVFVRAKELMKIIKEVMKADYVAVSIVGIDVPHFHVHLVPRYYDDGLADFWPTKKYEEGKAEEVVEKIKSFMK